PHLLANEELPLLDFLAGEVPGVAAPEHGPVVRADLQHALDCGAAGVCGNPARAPGPGRVWLVSPIGRGRVSACRAHRCTSRFSISAISIFKRDSAAEISALMVRRIGTVTMP